MATIRDVYFSHLPLVNNSKNISVTIFKKLLIKFNDLKDEFDLTKCFDFKMKNESLFNDAFDAILNGKMYEYVINESEFDGNKFYVDENVLIPRQETEELINRFYSYVGLLNFDVNKISIADVCTGSGCLGISIQKHYPKANVYLSDIDQKAINVAKKNCEINNVNCNIYNGDILKPLIENKVKIDCIICNPPYINSIDEIDSRTWDQEPHSALLADPSTKYYESLLLDVRKIINDKYLIAFEIGEDMKDVLADLVKKYLPNSRFKFEKDLDNKWRFLFIYNECLYKSASEALKNHGVIGFPTETVMGLGIAYDDLEAFEALNKIKRRPENKPYSLMLSDTNEIEKYAYLSNDEKVIVKAFLPGPLTILLKKKKLPKWVTLDSEYVGIRIPDIKTLRDAIREFGKPILAPSANRSGEAPALTNSQLKKEFENELDYVIDGDAQNSQPSTIVLIDNDVKIIREGPISKEDILEVLKNENSNR